MPKAGVLPVKRNLLSKSLVTLKGEAITRDAVSVDMVEEWDAEIQVMENLGKTR
jgi:hypothetical protein